jgi:hypothetical protein
MNGIRCLLLAFLVLATVAGYRVARAGSLEPPAAPAPTMQPLDTLDTKIDGIPASWYRAIDEPLRFRIVMDGEAALDTETGLVWERAPDSDERDWYDSLEHCLDRVVGNRMGWRLPAAEELRSLIDPGQAMPALPPNHPFTLPAGGAFGPNFWSTTARVFDGGPDPPSSAHNVRTDDGSRFADLKSTVTNRFAWCVRAGAGYDGGHN